MATTAETYGRVERNDSMSYPKSVLKKAMGRLTENREEQKRKNSVRKDKIYSELPELKDINKQIHDAMMEIFSGVSTDDIRKKLLEIDLKKREILKKSGYGENALENTYSCPLCKDEGFYDGSPCACYLSLIKEEAYNLSNIGKRIETENFDTYNENVFSDRKMASIQKNYALKYCEKDEKIPLNLFFFGGTGSGKTFLSSCIAKSFLDSGHSVLYLTATDLCDILDKAKFRKEEADGFNNEYLDFAENCDLLIIDDLGTEYTFSYPQSKMFDILEKRMVNKKRTIISTNLSLDDINSRYSPRFYSRILKEYKILQFKSEDLRLGTLKQ